MPTICFFQNTYSFNITSWSWHVLLYFQLLNNFCKWRLHSRHLKQNQSCLLFRCVAFLVSRANLSETFVPALHISWSILVYVNSIYFHKYKYYIINSLRLQFLFLNFTSNTEIISGDYCTISIKVWSLQS